MQETILSLLFTFFIVFVQLTIGENHFDHTSTWKPASSGQAINRSSFSRRFVRLHLAVEPVLFAARHLQHVGLVERNARLIAERKINARPKALREQRKPAAIVALLCNIVFGVLSFYMLLLNLFGLSKRMYELDGTFVVEHIQLCMCSNTIVSLTVNENSWQSSFVFQLIPSESAKNNCFTFCQQPKSYG